MGEASEASSVKPGKFLAFEDQEWHPKTSKASEQKRNTQRKVELTNILQASNDVWDWQIFRKRSELREAMRIPSILKQE